MELNWIIIVIVLVCTIALVFLLIKRNRKDEKEVTGFLNADIETKTKIENEAELHDDKV
jgi:preprotein translocase subunit YajC